MPPSVTLPRSSVIDRVWLSRGNAPNVAMPPAEGNAGLLLQLEPTLQLPSESTIQLPLVCASDVDAAAAAPTSAAATALAIRIRRSGCISRSSTRRTYAPAAICEGKTERAEEDCRDGASGGLRHADAGQPHGGQGLFKRHGERIARAGLPVASEQTQIRDVD